MGKIKLFIPIQEGPPMEINAWGEAEEWSWADIKNNGTVGAPTVNPWNEKQDKGE